MPLDEPAWWYGSGSGLAQTLTRPLGAVWGHITRYRFEHAARYRSPLPVICVGNFTAGGTGKTPLALYVAAELVRLGRRPAFLTRGYGGRLSGPHWVDAGNDRASDVGDEPLLLARQAPTLVARDRAAGARTIEAAGTGCDAIVMDDGLQNPSLAKDLVLAVVDDRRGLGNGRVIPAGPLRAPLDFQLGLADAIVANQPTEGAAASPGSTVEWLRNRFLGPVLAASMAPAEATGWLEGATVVAFAGIGNPQRFFDLLAKLGAEVRAAVPFPDHHRFRPADAMRLLALAEAQAAKLVTTEKDWVRLSAGPAPIARLQAATRALPVAMVFEERDRDRLAALLDISLKRRTEDRRP